MEAPQSSDRFKWALYLSLIALRFFGAIHSLPGYIHPDEFFQGGQELLFGQRLGESTRQHEYAVKNIPWEFEPGHAVRSIIPPMFMTLVPLRFYSCIKSMMVQSTSECKDGHQSSCWKENLHHISGKEILIIPRVFMTLLSVIFLDGSLWLLIFCRHAQATSTSRRRVSEMLYFIYQYGPPVEVIMLASSWPCLVFGIRPFTNTLETMCLAVLLVVVNMDLSTAAVKTLVGTVCVGLVCSIGIFVRFTFAFYAFPSVLIWIWHRWKMSQIPKHFMLELILLALAFLAASTMFIWNDSKYYSTQAYDGSTKAYSASHMMQYIAPLNAFMYNSKSTNLAEHGLHPRITHALVNMPMLFGPLALFWYGSITQSIFGKGTSHSGSHEDSMVNITCKWVVVSGLIVLSCAPHQEPRFLLPCLVPLVLLSGKAALGLDGKSRNRMKSTLLKLIWIAFNIILYIFFGWLHQGGLTEALLQTMSISSNSLGSIHIYYKTYMPPSFLARSKTELAEYAPAVQCFTDTDGINTCSNDELETGQQENRLQSENVILDLQGSEPLVLLHVLQSYLTCSAADDSTPIYLTTPLAVANTLNEKQTNQHGNHFSWKEYNFYNVYTSPHVHVSTEDWPRWDGSFLSFLSRLRLVSYKVTCTTIDIV
jgi:phosphatidylinositol glycan class Z